MLDTRLTEQRNQRSERIDELDPLALVELINDEDRRVAEAVRDARLEVARALELAEAAFRQGGRLIYVGAGTSGRLGVLDAAEMPPTYGTDPSMVQGVIAGGYQALVRAQEGAEDHPEDGASEMDRLEVGGDDFVLGIATSEDLKRAHDVVIAVLVGPEVVTGSTRMKAGTATKLVLNTITTGAMVRSGKVFGNLMVDLQVTCEKLQDRAERILVTLLGVERGRATELLRDAGGHVKTALVMGKLGTDAAGARARLEAHDGVVARALESTQR